MHVHQRKTDVPSYVLAWLITGVLISIFIVAHFFFWWHWAAWRRAAMVWELEEVKVVRCAWEVELHVELGDSLQDQGGFFEGGGGAAA
jgi:hypothetical protein